MREGIQDRVDVGRTDDHERRSQRCDCEPEYGALPVFGCALLQEGVQVWDGRLARGRRVDERDLRRRSSSVGRTGIRKGAALTDGHELREKGLYH